MMVRKYGRRNRGIIPRNYSDPLNDDVLVDPFDDSLPQESSQEPLYGVAFSSQDSSSHWSAFESDPFNFDSHKDSFLGLPPRAPLDDLGNGAVRKSKKARITKVPNNNHRLSIPVTSTLMETQEFGEMMEHVDEVNFALDGLRKSQPVRIRRASLLSLLSVCSTAQQRRLLQAQGMAKTILDAILGLNFDDLPSNLASAALFYVLTRDGQDDLLFESPSCIHFLIRLLKPILSTTTEDKLPKIGSKLLAIRTGADIFHNSSRKLDSSSDEIFSKVRGVLVSCKEIKSSYENAGGMEKLELCPKWIALLTIEKACFSAISLEDTSGTIRKAGGNFKEKLREIGGLDAVYEIAINCHSKMECWLEGRPTSDSKVSMDMQSLALLLRCLKIMENATFLSNDNQCHLLGMKGKLPSGTHISFVELVISVIKILSALYLLKNLSAASNNDKSCNLSGGSNHASELSLSEDCKGDNNECSFISSKKCSSSEKRSSDKSFGVRLSNQLCSTAQLAYYISSSEPSTSMTDTCSLKTILDSSTSGSCSGASRSLSGGTHTLNNGYSKNADFVQDFQLRNQEVKPECLEENLDPFAFDEDDYELSKWDVLSGKQTLPRVQKRAMTSRDIDDGCQSLMTMSQQDSSNVENHQQKVASCSTNEGSSLLSDCLLTAVKVLMNLTNDNPVGCRQIAAFGGLETMSSLIAGHFPFFTSSLSNEIKGNTVYEIVHQSDRPLTDQELDFLVAILGLLVNLVEKDGRNRSRLAAASVQLSCLKGLQDKSDKDVIPLLCSIFLANHGAGEAAQEGKALSLDDEDALVQGEKEAEKMILEAYAALLLAFLSTESKIIRDSITNCLPNRNLAILVPVLERFVAFHLTLNMISPETHKAVSEVIESCRIP